jgi:flavin reductase (DIM6/NTAB) family NADH-FMN oxidoreductase RutF
MGAPMTRYTKKDFPVSNVRMFLEPGPIVLVSSAWKGETNIMTMGWHMVMGEEPSLIGCYIWDANYSFNMIRKSKECVINIPTVENRDNGHSYRELLGSRHRQIYEVQVD